MCYPWMWSTTQGQAVDVLSMDVEHHTGASCGCAIHGCGAPHRASCGCAIHGCGAPHRGKLWMCYPWMWSTTQGQAVDVLFMDVEHHTGASCGCTIHGCGAPHRNLNNSFQCLDYNPTKNSLHRPSALHKQTRMWREMFSKVISYIT